MTEPNYRRSGALAAELKELPFASLQQIGKELRNDFREIIIEELPAEIQASLEKLERKLN